MKKNLFFIIACMAVFTFMSCSSDEAAAEQQNPKDEFVEVNFNFSGDFINVEEKPMNRGVISDPQTYYYIKLTGGDVDDTYQYPIGIIGFFSDLKYAKLRIPRNIPYVVHATALIESETQIDPEINSTIYCHPKYGEDAEFKFFNQFSHYIIGSYEDKFTGAVESPTYEDESVDRYFHSQLLEVESNETVDVKLDRFSYKLQLEIDPPYGGSIRLSCDKPNFSHKVYTDNSHASFTHIFALGGEDIDKAYKNITLKLEKLDGSYNVESYTTREITVKRNVETTVRVNFDQYASKNGFNLILNEEPMGKEEVVW